MIHLATVLLTFGVILGVLPRLIFPLREIPGTFLDRSIAGAVLLSSLTMAAMHVLGTLGMLETLAIVAVWIATWWIVKGRKRERGRGIDRVTRLFYLSDEAERDGVRTTARTYRRDAKGRTFGRVRDGWRGFRSSYPGHGAALVSIGVLVVLAVSAYLRFHRSLNHLELVPQDSYLALFTMKATTNGEILKEGIYPQGILMWLSMFDRFFPFDSHHFIRFGGPAMATLELIALYWVTSRVSRSRAAGLLSLSIFGLFAGAPIMFVDWSRQIGAMIQEMALAFAIISLVYGAVYMATRNTWCLVLATAGLFAAVTSHTVTMIPLAIGYTVIIAVGLVTASWDLRSLVRMIVCGMAAVIAGNLYFLIGWLKGHSLVQSFALYSPGNYGGFSGTGADVAGVRPGDATANNLMFQIGLIGALIAIGVGIVLVLAGKRHGRFLLAYASTVFTMMVVYDFILVNYGVLFRVRAMWATSVFMTIGIGLGLGAVAALAGRLVRVKDLLWERSGGRDRARRTLTEVAAAVVTLLFVGTFWPVFATASRDVGPSGYPQATQVSLDVISEEDRLTYTFVGASEQFQESAYNGWFVEAWVFARDIVMSDARDPDHEMAIPTDTVYVFAEKEVFRGPESRPFGPTEEYYRDTRKRERIMQRIYRWMELYSEAHDGVETVYDDGSLRVYKVTRKVDLEYALRSPDFKDYRWQPGEYFDEDGDITADRVIPNPDAAAAPAEPQPGAGP